MKLNLLILSLIGVSVSASGIRGFIPIKGSDRRLATPKSSSSKSKSSGGGGEAVARCVGDGCEEKCEPLTRKQFKALSLTTNKSSTGKSSDDRRLVSTSKSTSKSASTTAIRTIGDCTYEINLTGPSKSTSKSKERRRLKPTTSSSKSKSSGGGGNRVRTVGGTTVKCLNSKSRCERCHDSSKAWEARDIAFSYLSSSKSKGSSKSNRRLAPTSKSSSKSSSYDHGADLEVRYYGNCDIYRVSFADFDSSSSSSSKSKGR